MALQRRHESERALLDLAHVIARQAQLGPDFSMAFSSSQRSNMVREFLQVETITQLPRVDLGLALGSGRLHLVQLDYLYSAAFLLQRA